MNLRDPRLSGQVRSSLPVAPVRRQSSAKAWFTLDVPGRVPGVDPGSGERGSAGEGAETPGLRTLQMILKKSQATHTKPGPGQSELLVCMTLLENLF